MSKRIYTKTGDGGETGLAGGGRLKKNHYRIEAYGTIDELNAHLGNVRSKNPPAEIGIILERIQSSLFIIGGQVASSVATKIQIQPNDVAFLEVSIDEITEKLPPLKNFVLPGGSSISSELHIARTVCRRAERRIVSLDEKESIDPTILEFLNRLSDLLFVLARFANEQAGVKEIIWP